MLTNRLLYNHTVFLVRLNLVLKIRMNPEFVVESLSPNSKHPVKGSPNCAGLDLFSAHEATIGPWSNQLITTDLRFGIPPGYYAQLKSRSGLALRNNLHVCGGVIDRDYTGNVGVILMNMSSHAQYIAKHERIAQVLLVKILEPHTPDENPIRLSRGDGGFGSTN